MVSSDIKYKFNQVETGVIAFVGNLQLKLQKILPDLPVFILETGDLSYTIEEKFIKIENKEIYQKTPRFVLNIEDFQFQPDQNTNQYNKFFYKFEGIEYIATVRRMSVMVPFQSDFVSPNMIMAMQNFEIISTVMVRENPFTYEFLGSTIPGAYVLATPSLQKPGLEFSSATRNAIVKIPLELHLQLLVPRIETIQKLSDTGFDTVKFNFNEIGYGTFSNLEVKKDIEE